MLQKIFIDNFRCLVNFQISLDSINLFLGLNGSGKSSVFDALSKVQEFANGDKKVSEIFHESDCTRWQTRPVQSFEIEIEGNEGSYRYEIAIEHNFHRKLIRILHERLWFNDQALLKFEMGEAQLYRDNYSEGPRYPFDWTQSLLAFIPERADNTKLSWFKKRMRRFIIIKIAPTSVREDSDQETFRLMPRAENFVSWYRQLSQDQGKILQLINILKEVVEGFEYFKFSEAGEFNRILKVCFSSQDSLPQGVEYSFSEISDGQKVLFILYALIYGVQSEDYTLCIDEPENYLALPEIQPWLVHTYDLCNEGKLQTLLISHHPVLIDYLLASPIGLWFERQSYRPTRVQTIGHIDDAISISELIERGWLNASA